jgi:RND family efflux transporter MFP subunit
VSVSAPRFRNDLAAHRGELQGLCYYDVTDRRTGTTFRMYEVEYLVARALDGRPLDAVAIDVAAKLGIDTSADELSGYVDKLRDLGFLEAVSELEGDVSAALESAVLEPQSPAKLARSAIRPDKATSNESAAVAADDALRNVSQLFKNLAAQSEPPKTEPAKSAAPLAPMMFDDAQTRPVQPAAPKTPPPLTRAPTPPPLTKTATPPPLTQTATPPPLTKSAPPPPLPKTATPPPVPDVTPPLPLDALEEIEAEATPAEEFEQDTKTPIADPAQVEALVAKAKRSTQSVPAVVEAEIPDGTTKSVATALDRMSEDGAPEEASGLPAAVESTAKVHAMAMPKKRGTSPLWLAVPLVLGGLAAAIYLPSRHPAAAAMQVHVTQIRPETVVRLYPGAAQLHAVEPVKFSFPEGGKLAELLPPGQQVKPGDMLAKLDGYQKLEKALGEVRQREAFYQGELEKAERANNDAGIKHAQAKVEEKRGMIAAIQSKYGKLVLSSTAPGVVGENLAKVGDDINPGQPVTTVTQARLRADFNMPLGEAQSLKTGMIARLQREDGKLVDCRVEKVDEEGDQAIVRLEVMDTTGVQSNDRVRLVKTRLESVYKLPVAAVVHPTGGPDQVFVVQDGKARQRVITILDRDAKEVIVGQGLAPSDRVVTSGTLSLRDGAEVSLEP